MTIISKRRFGFTSLSVYRRREPHAFAYLSERATFWVAVLSVFAFVTGNMIGQHGWHVFWKSVMGEGIESTIVFTGMVPPVAEIPDYERWGKLGGDLRVNTFRQVPRDLLIPLPSYVHHVQDEQSHPELRRVYFVEHLGTYDTGRGKGSHAGVDISLPEGTPLQSIANGVVVRTGSEPAGFGNFIVIKHPNVPDIERTGEKSAIFSIYAHLSSVSVQEGTVVQKGDPIGLSGKTGFATAPHLHFQMDTASAPYHPYWPFNSADQRQAGLSFMQAIDAGLKRENGLLYTRDPMMTVQAYLSFTPPVTVAAADPVSSSSLSSSAAPRSKALTIADRRQARLAKLAIAKPTIIAFNDAAPVIPIPAPAPASSASYSSSALMTPAIGIVAGVRITHDAAFSRDRAWKSVTLTLLDAEGRVVTVPTENRKISLRTAFGKAEFKTSEISLSDFRKGVLTVDMLPLGEQTVVVQVQPYGNISEKPMKALR